MVLKLVKDYIFLFMIHNNLHFRLLLVEWKRNCLLSGNKYEQSICLSQ